MFTRKSKLEAAPPIQALKTAKWTAYAGLVISAASLPLLPASPLIHAAALPALSIAAWAISRQCNRYTTAFSELGKRRGFFFKDNITPTKFDENKNPVKPVAMWTAYWVPYDVVEEKERYGRSKVMALRKKLRADPEWLAILDEQRDWIFAHAPARWEVIERWWQDWFLQPLLRKRHNHLDDCTDKQIEAAAATMSVDLRIGITIGGNPELWGRHLGSNWDRICYKDLCSKLSALPNQGLDTKDPPPFPNKQQPRYDYMYLGRGFMFDRRHTQAMDDLGLQDLGDVTNDPKDQGDPRIFGIGAEDIRDIFIEEEQFKQMVGIFGSNGVGKTCYAQVVIDQAIKNGYPLVVIDPKSDKDLLNRIVETCRQHGRGHQFRYFSLAAPVIPDTWDFICKYNPLSDYNDPAELSSRVAALVPNTKDPFWSNKAKGMTEICLTLCHYANWFLRFLDRDHETGELAPKGSQRVPRVLLAMQWARHHPEASPEEADAAVTAIEEKMKDRNWTSTRSDEREVVAMLNTKSLSDLPIYCPNEWVPTIRHVSEYMIDGTVPFLGWMLRIAFPHLWYASDRVANPNFPRIAGNKEIVARNGGSRDDDSMASMWTTYQSTSAHPLEMRFKNNVDIPINLRRWVEFYDHFVPHFPDLNDDYYLTRFFLSFRKRLSEHSTECDMDRNKFIEQSSTLSSAIKPFLGELGRLMCAVDSDIVFNELVDNNEVLYCGLAVQLNRTAANSAAKMIAEDFISYIGRRYQYDNKRPPVYLIADEISSFINDGFIDLLNKARGAGLRGVIIGQTTPDLSKNLGQDGAKMVKGNLNTFIQLRSVLAEDARDFSERSGEVQVIRTSRSINTTPGIGKAGHKDINGFSSSEGQSFSSKDVRRVSAASVMNLPKGQAWIHAKGLVYLVAQGLFSEPGCNYEAEIGYKPGTLTDLNPMPRLSPAGRAPKRPSPSRSAPPRSSPSSPSSSSSPPRTPQRTVPGTAGAAGAAAATAVMPGTTPQGGTFRPQTDALALPDEPAEVPSSDPWPQQRDSTSRSRDDSPPGEASTFDDDIPPKQTPLDRDDDISVL